MKYTDRYFEFPVRVYDRYTAEKAFKQEAEEYAGPQEGEWVEGKVKIPYKEITVWSDYFDSLQGVEGVEKNGFEATVVFTKNEGVFVCTLSKKEFEKRLNIHVEEIEKVTGEENKKLEDRISAATGRQVFIQ